jgi:hypothetical protein
VLDKPTRQPQGGCNTDSLHNGLARGSTDVALRPPKRMGIDTATCDGALTLQTDSSQSASSLPRHAAEPGDATAQTSSSAADLHCNENSCKRSSSCCTSSHATAQNAAALGACPDDQMALLPEDEAPREAAAAAAAAATKTSSSVTAQTQQQEQLRDAPQLLADPPIIQPTCEPGRGERP